MDAAQRASFRENGYLVLRRAVDPAHIEALRALFDQHAIPEVRAPCTDTPTDGPHSVATASLLTLPADPACGKSTDLSKFIRLASANQLDHAYSYMTFQPILSLAL